MASTHTQRRQRIFRGLLCGIAGVLIALVCWQQGWLDIWEARTWDWRASLLAAPGKATDTIRLILVDQESLDWAEKENGIAWRWPRELFAAIINYCRRTHVKALAFDVMFSEFSQYGVEDDAVLGEAIAAFPSFAGSIFLSNETGDTTSWPEQLPLPQVTIKNLEQWLRTSRPEQLRLQRAVMPIGEVLEHTDVLSNVQHKADPDGVYRRLNVFHLFDHAIFPTLGLGTYLASRRELSMRIEPGTFLVGSQAIPLDRHGNALLRYRGPVGTHRSYSAAQILQAEIRHMNGEPPTEEDQRLASDLAQTYVLFGFSAPGLYDLRPTPVGGAYPGVEINATFLDNLLSGDFMAALPSPLTVVLALVLALSTALLASHWTTPLQNVVIGILFLALPVLLALGGYYWGYWVPLVVQEVAEVLTLLASLVMNYASEGRQKRFLKQAFKQYLSPAVIDQLLQHPEQLKLGGERRPLSMFFSDLQGFTSISEQLEPEALTSLLNDYLSAMTDIIHDEQGTIDKYEGDAIIAFWNAPLNVPDHAIRAVRAALRCQRALAAFTPASNTHKTLLMRIGINTGPAVIGNMGSHTRFDYTMLGDAVNLASRLEGVNKQFGTYTIIAQSTRDLLGDTFATRELARVAVVGRKEPVTIYEPMLPEDYLNRKQTLDTFAEGLRLFYRGSFTHALEVFTTLRGIDPPATAYAGQCRRYMLTPPAEWQGVWVMMTK